MVVACSRAKLYRRDWKTSSWVWRDAELADFRDEPWAAYCWAVTFRFVKAPRPTPRLVDIVIKEHRLGAVLVRRRGDSYQ